MRESRFGRRAARGESLVERLVAMAIFAIGVLGALRMNVAASDQNALARRQTIATAIARDLVDALERTPFTHPALTPGTVAITAPEFTTFEGPGLYSFQTDWGTGARPLMGATDALLRSEGNGGRSYQAGWRVAAVEDANGNREALHIAVMVRFTVPSGGTKQVTLWTTKYNPALVVDSPVVPLEI